ncbi:hypothetical protein T492DRAFT_306357 [Pavlovales sp. CCMP2436]|nr:hypothetical protein T492DRAFT_306357 [Pavlovales sp. CCMP2436]
MNIGVIFARPAFTGLAQAWISQLSKGSLQWDQNVFYTLMSSRKNGAGFADEVQPGSPGSQLLTLAAKDKRLGLVWDGKLLAGVLPTSLFCTGFTFVSGHTASACVCAHCAFGTMMPSTTNVVREIERTDFWHWQMTVG